MIKKTTWICNNCGFSQLKWQGNCNNCNSWNTFIEKIKSDNKITSTNNAINIKDVDVKDFKSALMEVKK